MLYGCSNTNKFNLSNNKRALERSSFTILFANEVIYFLSCDRSKPIIVPASFALTEFLFNVLSIVVNGYIVESPEEISL